LFGSAPTPAPFGAPAPSTGFFGAPAAGGGFGAKPPESGFFGSSAPAPGGFGAPPFASTMAQQPVIPANTYVVPEPVNAVVAQQVRALVNERKELEKFDVWKGKSPSGGSRTTPTNQAESDSLSRPAYLPHIASTPTSAVKIRPRGFFEDNKSKTPPIAPIGRDNRAVMTPESFARSSALTLVVLPESEKKLTQRRPLRLNTSVPSPSTATKEDIQPPPEDVSPPPPSSLRATAGQSLNKSPSLSPDPLRRDPGEEYYNKLIGAENPQFSPPATTNNAVSLDSSLMPKLTKPGYEVSPSIEDMKRMSEADLATVAAFSVRRTGVGMVEWEGAVDIRGADLDSIISIEPKAVEVYSLEEEQGTKPAVGSKLNRPAIITCYDVFPPAGRNASEEERNRYAQKVAMRTTNMGAELIDYNKNSGVWKIRVQHFSRYALVDDDSDNDEGLGGFSKNEILPSKRDLDPKPLPIMTKQSRTTQQDMDCSSHSEDATMVSDVDIVVESLADRYRIEADMVSEQIELKRAAENTKVAEPVHVVTFENEGQDIVDDYQPIFVIADPNKSLRGANTSYSICNRIAAKCKVPTSSIDMGMRMRRSFRVGWLPNGSFLQLQRGSVSDVLLKRRPLVNSSNGIAAPASILSNHVIQANLSEHVENAPLFMLPGRDLASPKLIGAIQSLATSSSLHSEVRHGLMMLTKLLFFHSDSDSVTDRQVTAAHDFLIDVCHPDVEPSILDGNTKTTSAESVFAALSSADLDRSCHLASEAGCLNLLVALTVGNAERREFIRQSALLAEQGCASKVESAAVRVMKALGHAGDYEDLLQSQQKNSLDWRRRLALRLWQSEGKDLKKVIETYDHDILLGKAPFPHAAEKSIAQDMLYKLLLMCAGIKDGVCEVIDPTGFSQDLHDCSHSFYLGLAICCSNPSAKITNYNAERLVDGYVSQLVSQGQWIWAVFISLCAFAELNPTQQALKRFRAKQIVLQHFDAHDSSVQDFLLKKVGIPDCWLSEALAIRGLYKHDLNQLIDNTMAFDRKSARILLEELYLPELFFRNDTEEILKAQKLIEESEAGTLAATMHKYFDLEMQLSDPQVGRNLNQLQHLLTSLAFVENALSVFHKMLKSTSVCRLVFLPAPSSRSVSAMISTALDKVNQRRLEIECVRRSAGLNSEKPPMMM
jgi:nuclear pore complex protein Nup98-Nup96